MPIRALKDRLPRLVLQSASLDQAIMLITDLAPHVQPYTPVLLSQQVDKIIWRWRSNGGLYSANSVYKVLTAGVRLDGNMNSCGAAMHRLRLKILLCWYLEREF